MHYYLMMIEHAHRDAVAKHRINDITHVFQKKYFKKIISQKLFQKNYFKKIISKKLFKKNYLKKNISKKIFQKNMSNFVSIFLVQKQNLTKINFQHFFPHKICIVSETDVQPSYDGRRWSCMERFLGHNSRSILRTAGNNTCSLLFDYALCLVYYAM